ncbi:MAG: NUDIX domain-containing protein [Clostridiales bacterium]|nr:NUDIX domain-containing protein [Clostridiales bacterium]
MKNYKVTNREEAEKQHPSEKAVFMNMCMLCDGDMVLALDKIGSGYSGTTFPGGHVEAGETFSEAVIREMQEETGLTIRQPILKGIYHWYRESIHNVGLLYRADSYEGKLKSSEEGQVYWISRDEYEKKDLAVGMRRVLQIMDDDNLTECYMDVRPDGSIQEYMS